LAKFFSQAPGTNVTSCNVTAGFLGQVISANPLTVFQTKANTPQKKRVAEIKRLLAQPRMIYIAIAPDHHFIVFSVDTDKMVILQGFQDVYNFNDWWTKRGRGIIGTKAFLDYMSDLVSGNEARRQSAARALFSFRLADVIDPAVEIAIFDYFKADVSINTIASKLI
jgi:hypothetical protein